MLQENSTDEVSNGRELKDADTLPGHYKEIDEHL